MEAHQKLIGPMDAAELRRAIEGQAGLVGLGFEADLVNTILDDVRDEPGAMPLLQHALHLLWKRRHGQWLRTKEYRDLGGVKQAIALTADELYKGLTHEQQKQVQDIFLRLTRLDEDKVQSDTPRDTRQRVRLEDLTPAGSDDSDAENDESAGRAARRRAAGGNKPRCSDSERPG